MKLQTVPDEHY